MKPENKMEFTGLLIATLDMYDKKPSDMQMEIWWNVLANKNFDEVKHAFSEHVKTGKFAPRPADILEIFDAANPDGRLSADEAWALCPRNEAVTVVMTDEMATAWGVAKPLLDERDQVAARMAFKESYNRLVGESRRTGKDVKWFISMGDDKGGREGVILEAVQLGRISGGHAQKLLPNIELNELMLTTQV